MDIQNIVDKTNKKNLYLFFRFGIYLLLVMVSLDRLYSINNIDSSTYFNNIFLYSAPLVIEYIFSMDNYNNLSKITKNVGFFITVILLFISILGLFGVAGIKLSDETNFIEKIYLYGNNINIIFIIPWLTKISCICNLGDWIFSYNAEELRMYDLYNEVNQYIKEEVDNKKINVIEDKKKKYKDNYRKEVISYIKGDN